MRATYLYHRHLSHSICSALIRRPLFAISDPWFWSTENHRSLGNHPQCNAVLIPTQWPFSTYQVRCSRSGNRSPSWRRTLRNWIWKWLCWCMPTIRTLWCGSWTKTKPPTWQTTHKLYTQLIRNYLAYCHVTYMAWCGISLTSRSFHTSRMGVRLLSFQWDSCTEQKYTACNTICY